MSARRSGVYLTGVFLGPDSPDGQAPQAFNCGDLSASEITPVNEQLFCIGDGLTPASEQQDIVVPPGATRLYLGYMSRYYQPNSPFERRTWLVRG